MDAPQTPPPLPAIPSAVGHIPKKTWLRLGAAGIDVFILLLLVGLLGAIIAPNRANNEEAMMAYTLENTEEIQKVTLAALEKGGGGADEMTKFAHELVMKAMRPSWWRLLLAAVLGVAAYIGCNWKWLPSGQTIGTMLLGLRVQNRATRTPLSVQDFALKHLAPVSLGIALATLLRPYHPWLAGVLALLLVADLVRLFLRSGGSPFHDELSQAEVVEHGVSPLLAKAS